jgi:predicted RND superfamily exporter protein
VDFKHKLARRIIHFRIYIIATCIFISLYFISVLKDIKIEIHLEDFLPKMHPFIKVQHKLTDIFGGLNQVCITLKVKEGDIFIKVY